MSASGDQVTEAACRGGVCVSCCSGLNMARASIEHRFTMF